MFVPLHAFYNTYSYGLWGRLMKIFFSYS